MTQPEALRLAAELDKYQSIDFDGDFAKCAAELLRLHAENELWKTMPMKYRRMEFNAQLQGENERLVAQRDVLLEVVQKYVAWSHAENDHKSTTFWERVAMCHEVDQLARAAIAAVEGEKE